MVESGRVDLVSSKYIELGNNIVMSRNCGWDL